MSLRPAVLLLVDSLDSFTNVCLQAEGSSLCGKHIVKHKRMQQPALWVTATATASTVVKGDTFELLDATNKQTYSSECNNGR